MDEYDWLIVGAGYSGSVLAERIASQLDQKVLLVDKRDHIAGNAYDYRDDAGVLIHKYGPHIFHTNSKKVWEYLSEFTDWRYYFHEVLAIIEGKKVPIPFNFNSIKEVFPEALANKFENLLLDKFEFGKKIPILKLLNEEDKDLKLLADYIYKFVFKGYTSKQWGLNPDELDKSVTGRIPVYLSRDNRYFQDAYQAIPLNGYTAMFEQILDHPNITLVLNEDGIEYSKKISYHKMIYTGPIDEFFDNKFGPLPYRSLEFKYRTFEKFPFQERAQINYPNNFDFTRITEFAYLTGEFDGKSTIAIEYPKVYIPGVNDPYYPIPNKENEERFKLYLNEAKKVKDKVIFLGRLADYKYYNMDQVVARALKTFETEILTEK